MARTYGIKGQYELSIDIEGQEVVATASNVGKLNIIETYQMHLPSLELSFQDDSGKFLGAIGDGSKITINFGDGRGGGEKSVWSVQGVPQMDHGQNSYIISLNALLDNIAYSRKVLTGFYEGTASEVVARIAGEVGLKANVGSTSDKQVWLPNNRPIAGFVKSVVGHAYSGAQSVFANAITETGELRMKDLSTLIGGGTNFGLGGIPILTYNVRSLAGVANHNRAAGSHTSGYDMEGTFKELTDVTATFIGSALGFSAGTKESFGALGGRLDKIVREGGNTHEKYLEARHQNKRLRGMYSTDLNVMTDVFSGVSVMDGVTATPPSLITHSNSTVEQRLMGNYIISSKTRSLQGTQYFERLVFTTQG